MSTHRPPPGTSACPGTLAPMEQRLRDAIEASKDAIETNTGVRPDFILTDDPSF